MLWLLHGNLGSPADWKPVESALGPGGLEGRARNLWKYPECCPKSLTQMGRILCAEIAAQDKHPLICGYSLGGRLAMHAVLAQPTMWAGAVFVCANPGLEQEEERAARRVTDAEWAVKCHGAPWDEFLTQWDAQPVFAGAQPRDRAALKPWRNSISRAFIDWSVCAQDYLLPALQACGVPQLWVAGERDAKFCALAQGAAGEHAVIVPGAGHRILQEAPDALAAVIINFIN